MAGDEYILAVDLGTSGPKVALCDLEGGLVATAFEPTGLAILPGGGAEQDPEEWWAAIVRATRRVVGERGVAPAAVRAVCCTSQWSSTVAVDDEGRAIGPAINWMDSRGARHVEAIMGGHPRIEGYNLARLYRWISRTGGAPTHSGKDSIAHILFLKAERPEIYERAACFLEPKDYLNARLTGELAASFDSIALHWVTDNRDLARVTYDPALCEVVGVPRTKFPALRRAVDTLGAVRPEVARELGIGEGALVICGTPDVQSAALGSGVVADFAGHLYVGTSSWITCHVPFKKTSLVHNMASLPSAVPLRYFVACEQECAGKCLTYLRDQVFFPDDALNPGGGAPAEVYRLFDELAAGVPAGSDGLLFMPWLYGERTPVDDHDLRGGFVHLSLASSRAHLVRAVLEGVALNASWLCDHVEGFCGRGLGPLRFIGGGARSPLWSQIFADVLDREIHVVEAPLHANVRGAGLLAACALGHIEFDDIEARVKVARSFTPDPGRAAIYRRLASELVGMYRSTRKLHRRLAAIREAGAEERA